MCLIALAIDSAPGRRLLIAANRDEDWQRPTEALHRWQGKGGAQVIGGRDLREGGSWMAIDTAGRIALLTNVRQAGAPPGARSRGELVANWLHSGQDAAAFASEIDPAAYAGFNLVVGDLRRNTWVWMSNRSPLQPHEAQPPALHCLPLGAGVHALSNASLNTRWHKAQRLRSALQTAVRADSSLAPESHPASAVREALTDTQPAPDDMLPTTGLPLAFERALSSPFVRMPQHGYGTRSSSWLSVAADGSVSFEEWTHDPAHPVPALRAEHHRREVFTVA